MGQQNIKKGMRSMIVQNEMSLEFMAFPIRVFLLFSLIGIAFYYISGVFMATASFILALFLLTIMWYQRYVLSPKMIDISENVFTAYFVLNRSKHFLWEDMQFLNYNPRVPSKKGSAQVVESDIRVKGRDIPMLLEASVALELRESYKNVMGRYPPMKFNERK